MARLNQVPKRLKALEEILRGSDSLTVNELCTQLNVSRRTLFRDLGYLRDQGLPVSSDVGRGGGIRFERAQAGYSVSFSSDEVVALWLSTHVAEAATSVLPWGPAAKSGLQRLFSSLPRERMRELRFLCKRVVVGYPASDRIRDESANPPTELLGAFEKAFTRRHGLGFNYVDRNGAKTARRIEPHGLLVELPVWYILAVDLDKKEPRMFRMDRISKPKVLDHIRFVPDADVIRSQTAHIHCTL